MKFVDEAIIEVRSGNGAPGSVHFMRQKYMPKMGPDGGDGGRGGDVFIEASSDLQSLLDFKFISKYAAKDGEKGMGQDCNGCDGESLTLRVPLGTTIRDAETGELLADLVMEGTKLLFLRGGKGGLGNMNFATPTRQAPDFAQTGLPGHTRKVVLELKLLADVGTVGFPNAGKSTLISRWSAARPKIADYPFTTLIPNLGVVRGKSRDFVLADIPGIIEGAHEGRGLGVKFLKHCERTRLLVILLDLDPSTGRQMGDEIKILESEMRAFSAELGDKPRLVAINKTDAFAEDPDSPLFMEFLKERGYDELVKHIGTKPFLISCVTGAGLEKFKDAVEEQLKILGPRVLRNEITSALRLGSQEIFEDEVADLEDDET